MTDLKIKRAYDAIIVDDETKEQIFAALSAASAEKEAKMHKTHRSYNKTFIILAAAIVLTAAFAVSSFADEIFGIKAVEIEGQEDDDGMLEISLSQPQTVPEEYGSEIREKIDNSTAAWAEWCTYRDNDPEKVSLPELFIPPEGADGIDSEENEDGTYRLMFWKYTEDYSGQEIIEERTATAAEYEQAKHYYELQAKGWANYGSYDNNYGVYSEKAAAELESIAAKYSLQLRRERRGIFASDSYTNEECAEMTAQMGPKGNIFYTVPAGFDKLYWFNEGTFCVSFYLNKSSDSEKMSVYLYNSPYTTLSSGFEVISLFRETETITTRYYTAKDGTELTVLEAGNQALIYVYLDDSFVTLSVWAADALEEADINAAADSINYSLIK